LLLMVSLLLSSTPAAASTVVSVAKESAVDFSFWYHASGLANFIQGQGQGLARGQEQQAERDAKVARVQIYPGDLTIDVGERVRFAAVAYDADNNPVGGVKIKWKSQGANAGNRIRLSPAGELEGVVPGSFTITAEAAKREALVNVVVRPGGVIRDPKLPPTSTRKVSTRDLPASENGAAKQPEKTIDSARALAKVEDRNKRSTTSAKRAHAARRNAAEPMPFFISNGWDDTNYWSADDPGNGVGTTPGNPIDGGAGSGNFQLVAPVLGTAGRGINISLALSYNSRVWNKAGSNINYDNDHGWPAPGFNLGFGKLLGITINSGCMIVEADGTRHPYSGSITFYSWGTVGVMHTTDGSFIDYTYQTGTNGVITYAQARLQNGTVINYGAYSQPGGGVFPTSIYDANGNYIVITYVNNSGPRIQTITDTLGRVINFNYDYNNLLTAVTAAGLGGGTRTLARLHYHQHSLNWGFSGLTASARDYYPWVIDAIYYPATSTGYWFNDSDSYSSYGMLAKVVEERSMGFSSSGLTDMGSVWQGSVTRSETYNYPLTPNYSLTDAPTYTQLVESWSRDGTNFDSATTNYSVNENSSPRSIVVTLPNGTKTKQLSYNAPGQWNDGLVYHDESYVTEGQPLQSSDVTWQSGDYSSPRPTRLEKRNELSQVTATEFSYGSLYNQVTDVRDYDYGGTALIRSTRTTYQNSATYTGSCNSYGCYGRHIFNLPLTVEIYAGDNVTRVSRTDYQYDGQPLSAAPGVVMHDQASNSHAEEEGFCYWDYDWNDPDCTGSCWDYSCDGYCPQYYVCPYDSSTDYRGLVTQTTTYANAAALTGPVTQTKRYDVTGNLVQTTATSFEQTSYAYSVNNQYAQPLSRTQGSPTDPYAQITTSATYDFYTDLVLSTTDADGRTATTSYDSNSLRPSSTISPTGAHTDYAYNDATMSTTRTAYLAAADGGGVTEQSVRYLNGRGQLRQEQALGTGGVWDIIDQVYDNMGQLSQQTRPYRSGDTPQWSTTTYDALGRTATVTGPDGSVTQTFYNEASRPSVASSSPGETTRMQDAWGRERWGRANASGRIVEVVEPDPNGSGSVASNGMVTTYAYDTLAKLTQITQGSQTRSLKYDSLGRLIAQKMAEASATLNDAGTYVGSGSWSDVFTYDERSNLVTRTDARGVKTVFTYSNDPLNRLQSVSWDTSGFGDTANPIVAAATISYQYRTKSSPSDLKDITQPATITTAGVSTESYAYDTQGRLSSSTLTLTSRSSYPFVTDYIYDSLDRAKDVRYPAEYGNGSTRRLVHNDFDVAGRVSGLTFDGQTQASNITYNAASQTTAITVGTGTNQVSESYSYNAQTGMLDSQTATRNGTQLLNLSYDYAGANGKRTGQLVKISNNLDHNKDRGYEYDALGRLRRATGGQSVNWTQNYNYDRYGNRNNVFSHTADQYIRNFYQSALNRQPNSTELNSWLSTLQSAYAQGMSQFWSAMQSLGAALFTSSEYASRGRTDHWYVYDLYRAYLWRDPDAGGWSFWEQGCAQNGRDAVRAGFDWSVEFNLHVNGTSPYSPPGGATVPTDGWGSLWYDNASNHLAVPGWSYDAAGNQTRVQTASGWQRFQYDAANRLVKVKADDNVTVLTNTTYGSSSERLIAEEGGNRTYYVSEDGAVYAEFSESGASTTPLWSKSYIYLGDRLLSTVTPNGGGVATEYQHPDRLGTRLVTNPASGTSFEQVTLPYGTALASESTGSTNRRFTTYDRSATTGLDYAVNRHYDPLQGRFTQVDPDSMNATSLENPQTLNLYSYCANDPVNNTDPSGLGFFSFLKKLFKWVVAALAVIAAVLTIIYNPVLFMTTFKAALGIIASITNAASQVLNALGVKTASAVFGIISAGASFGLSLAALWAPLEEKGGMIAKNIFKAIQDGATLASRTMTALGHNMVGQILDLASTVAGFISTGYVSDKDKDGKPIKGKFHFDPSAWAIYKVARATAEKIAVFSGNKALGDYLNIAGLAEDAYTLYRGMFHFNHEPKEGEKGGDIYGEAFKRVDGKRASMGSNNAISIALIRLVRRQDRVVRLGNLARRVNTAFGRMDKIVALSH
jgi:RHS repeat-associated protein